MNTDDLIASLSADTRPVRHTNGARRVAGALLAGGIVSLIAIDLALGAPLRAIAATGVMAFAFKLSYAVALTVVASILLLVSGRPGQRIGMRWTWLLVPIAVVCIASAMELAQMPAAGRLPLVFGTTWQTCLAATVLMSIPVYVALLWALRRFAPTRLSAAGFLAGLTSGAMASVIYALYCPETSASFMLAWYTLAIVISGLLGAAAGRRLLRW